MKETILAISGKSGLFTLVSQGRNTIIVETLDEAHKRGPVTMHDRITSLRDVSMYSETDEVPLMKVFANIYAQLEGKPSDLSPKTASKAELEDFMAMALPDYDRERVYQNDIRKLITWYNILVKNGVTDFEDEDETAEDEAEAE